MFAPAGSCRGRSACRYIRERPVDRRPIWHLEMRLVRIRRANRLRCNRSRRPARIPRLPHELPQPLVRRVSPHQEIELKPSCRAARSSRRSSTGRPKSACRTAGWLPAVSHRPSGMMRSGDRPRSASPTSISSTSMATIFRRRRRPATRRRSCAVRRSRPVGQRQERGACAPLVRREVRQQPRALCLDRGRHNDLSDDGHFCRCAATRQRVSIFAPCGLSDLLGLIVRPNKKQITRPIYEAKVEKWLARWPGLRVMPWEAGPDG